MRTREQEQARFRGLSPEDVARRWGCSAQHVRDLIMAGALRAINVSRPGAKRANWSILPADLDAFEKARESRGAPEAAA